MMFKAVAPLVQGALMGMEPERAHRAALQGLKLIGPLARAPRDDARLRMRVFGLDFANPVGMAAGFDKNAEVPDALLNLGFGFAEIGTVTPLPQAGNPRPRMFRLPQELGVINRLGFNNDGHEAARARLLARRGGGIVGVNLGANKDASDRIADYVSGVKTFAALASYFTINVSSPNTPGLRDLQAAEALDALLARVIEARDGLGQVPILLKIAPDQTLETLDDIVGVARKRRIDGMIVSNTTISRPEGLRGPVQESGGLSGKPLFGLATAMLRETYLRVEGQFPLIGVGGIHDGASAYAKIKAGASLIQAYSAFAFKGLALLDTIKAGLVAGLESDGYATLAEAIGRADR